MTGVEAQARVKVGAIIKTEYGTFYIRERGTVGGRPAFVRIEIIDGMPCTVGRKTGLVADCEFKMVTA
jgi:hypothetical protein